MTTWREDGRRTKQKMMIGKTREATTPDVAIVHEPSPRTLSSRNLSMRVSVQVYVYRYTYSGISIQVYVYRYTYNRKHAPSLRDLSMRVSMQVW